MNDKLTSCDDCGGKVSKRAATCPHCGAPQELIDEIEGENEEDQDAIDERKHEELERFLKKASYSNIPRHQRYLDVSLRRIDYVDIIAKGFFVFLASILIMAAFFRTTDHIFNDVLRFILNSPFILKESVSGIYAKTIESRSEPEIIQVVCPSIILSISYLVSRFINDKKNLKDRKRIFIPIILGCALSHIVYMFFNLYFLLSNPVHNIVFPDLWPPINDYNKILMTEGFIELLTDIYRYSYLTIVPLNTIVASAFMYYVANIKRLKKEA